MLSKAQVDALLHMPNEERLVSTEERKLLVHSIRQLDNAALQPVLQQLAHYDLLVTAETSAQLHVMLRPKAGVKHSTLLDTICVMLPKQEGSE